MEKNIKKQAIKIANAIVELVERTDGPVTLAQVSREVPGFAEEGLAAWSYTRDIPGGEMLIWDNMTEAGGAALREVIEGRRVAIQYVNLLPYLLDNYLLADENWRPIMLLPVKAANLETPSWLVRASKGYRDYSIKRAAAEGKTGYRLLKTRPMRFVADQFVVA